MSDLDDVIAPEAVLAALTASSKKTLLQSLASAAAAQWGYDAGMIAERLLAREKLGSTGFGGGIAIPHARLDGIDHVRGLFARLTRPVDYTAVDDQPVDLVFLLLSPVDAGAEHLKALARVSRKLRDPALTARLRGAGSADALYALLTRDAG